MSNSLCTEWKKEGSTYSMVVAPFSCQQISNTYYTVMEFGILEAGNSKMM